MDALKLCPLSYLTVWLLVLVNIQDGAAVVTCYNCEHGLNGQNPACVDGTSTETKDSCPTCSTQWVRNTANNAMQFVIRGCASPGETTGCTTKGGRESCEYVCNDDLCNTDVYIPPTTTPGTTTTAHPKYCFECFHGESIKTDHCLIVNGETRVSKPCDNGCQMIVRFDIDDHSSVTDMKRGCNTGDDVKSFCRGSGDNYNCYTFCVGHMCNHDDYFVKPEDDNGNPGGDNGQMGTTQSSSFYALTLVLLVSLLLTL